MFIPLPCQWIIGSFKEAAKKVKLQINSFLLRQDQHWNHTKWTYRHRKWLSEMRMPNAYLQQVLEEHLAHLDYLEARLEHLAEQIEQIASSTVYAPAVKTLVAMKGIKTLTAMLLIVEITDFCRLANPRALMAFLGLIPSEGSSGDKRKDDTISRAGNKRCRTVLIESVQHYARSPHMSAQMKSDLSQLDRQSAGIAVKCLK